MHGSLGGIRFGKVRFDTVGCGRLGMYWRGVDRLGGAWQTRRGESC